MRAPCFEASDRELAWALLQQAYLTSDELSDAGYELCRQRFLVESDRTPLLVETLGREILRRRTYDPDSLEVLILLAQREDELGASARRAVVRFDARLRVFSPDRLPWYREALAEGSLSAAFIIAGAAVKGLLAEADLSIAAARRCLKETNDRPWQACRLERADVELLLARMLVMRPVDPALLPEVRRGLDHAPRDAAILRYLAAAYRPGAEPEEVEVYRALFAVRPDDADNCRHLASLHLAGQAEVDDPPALLRAYLALGPEDPQPIIARLALAAAEREWTDDESLAWLRQVAAEPEPPAQVVGWLAVRDARAREISPESVARRRQALADSRLPATWRGEIGLSLVDSRLLDDEPADPMMLLTWEALEPEQRPDWLALALARQFARAGRVDSRSVSVYQRVHELEPSTETERLLAAAYLRDRETPLRVKIAHWRAALANGLQDPDVVAALAQGYAQEGAQTEAAISVVEQMPAAQQPAVLDELCRHRFRQREFAAAEAIAGRLVQLRPDCPDTLCKLLLCRVRRAMTEGQPLRTLDLSAAEAYPDHRPLRDLLALVAAAAGLTPTVDDAALVTLVTRHAGGRPALMAAAAVLSGESVRVPPMDDGNPQESWLLAAVDEVQGNAERAARRLEDSRTGELRLWARYLEARRDAEQGDEDRAWRRLLPVCHRTGPPWNALQPVLIDLALRHAEPEILERMRPAMDDQARRLATMREVALLAGRGELTTAAARQRLGSDAPPALLAAITEAEVVHQAAAHLAAGRLEQAEAALEPLADCAGAAGAACWLRALLACRRGDPAQACQLAFGLAEADRRRPVVALCLAAWFAAGGHWSRAAAVIADGLAEEPANLDLLLAAAAVQSRLDRGAQIGPLIPALLRALPGDDPRRAGVELLGLAVGRPLAEVGLGDLATGLPDQPEPLMLARLKLMTAVVASRLASGRAATVAPELRSLLRDLTGAKLPRPAVHWLQELCNLLAYACYLNEDHESALGHLQRIRIHLGAVSHNLALAHEAAGEPLAAAGCRLESMAEWGRTALDHVAPEYTERLLFHGHRRVARLFHEAGDAAAELAQLRRCLEFRPRDIDTQRAILQPLLALGEIEQALHRSRWLIGERPDDIEVVLDHATVLVSSAGGEEATAYLDQLATDQPGWVDAIRQKKDELRQRLMEAAHERAEAGEFMAMFAAARDAERLAVTDEDRARAAYQQVLALYRLAGDNEIGPLEQAYNRCVEVMELPLGEQARQRVLNVQERVAVRLAPLLVQQADGLLLHRRRELAELREKLASPPSGAVQQAASLAGAFGRVADQYRRAAEMGSAEVQAAVTGKLQQAGELEQESQRLRELFAGAR